MLLCHVDKSASPCLDMFSLWLSMGGAQSKSAGGQAPPWSKVMDNAQVPAGISGYSRHRTRPSLEVATTARHPPPPRRTMGQEGLKATARNFQFTHLMQAATGNIAFGKDLPWKPLAYVRLSWAVGPTDRCYHKAR